MAFDSVVLVHNGIVVNCEHLWQELENAGCRRRTDVDSEVIAALLSRELAAGQSVAAATRKAFSVIRGETTIAAMFSDNDQLVLATNTGSLYVGWNAAHRTLFFASELLIAREVAEDPSLSGFAGAQVKQIRAGSGVCIDLKTLAMTDFDFLAGEISSPMVAPRLAATRRIESRWQRDEDARASLRRCTRCILPETMPFIEFDANGVCNYCRNYRSRSLLGRPALEETLASFRKGKGEIDCLVAFSGGRDSSFGLHLLKKEFGMTPLAYTFDWGMVTGLGRRNQARMCGALGVEHLWISADIRKQREYIRKNVSAWMKRPDLGIIPLFMAGDKLFFRHANQTARRHGNLPIIFFMNPLERTDFKSGFCGVRPYSGKTNFALGWQGKLSMLAYYGKNFAANPRYLNSSLLNTANNFLSYYFEDGDYIYPFNYLAWKEDEVDRTLLGEYDWETSPDLESTWRIGDGTAPFYNYVYYTAAGFTEFDTFRSNQIREGHISREFALNSVRRTNQPRWEAIQDYCRTIDVSFDRLVAAVDGMPRLYGESGVRAITHEKNG